MCAEMSISYKDIKDGQTDLRCNNYLEQDMSSIILSVSFASIPVDSTVKKILVRYNDDQICTKCLQDAYKSLKPKPSENPQTCKPVVRTLDQKDVVSVTYILSLNKFYVQKNKDFIQYSFLEKRLQRIAKTSPNLDDKSCPGVGSHLLGQYEDDKWYRCVVVEELKDNAVKVFFIDFGNCQRLPPSKLKTLSPEYASCAPYAIECSLDITDNLRSDVDQKKLSEAFLEIVRAERWALTKSMKYITVKWNLYQFQPPISCPPCQNGGFFASFSSWKRKRLSGLEWLSVYCPGNAWQSR